ncbi:hypothetical protein HY995_00630 [Candidatus Micrarchaeota archaeon]|nr:hypothetical protein [Candidatus Micrarchaeota archaeon]
MVLSAEPMVKVRIVTARRDVTQAIDALYEFGAIQVTRAREGEPGVPLAEFEGISTSLIRLRSFEKTLGLGAQARQPKELLPLHSLLGRAKKVEERFDGIVAAAQQEMSSAATERTSLLERRRGLEPFAHLKTPPKTLSSLPPSLAARYCELLVPKGQLLKAVGGDGEVAFPSGTSGKGTFALMLLDARKAPQVDERISKMCRPIPIPQSQLPSFLEEIAEVGRQVRAAEVREKGARKKIAEFTRQSASEIAELRAHLEGHAKKAELPNRFSQSDYLEVIEGWVPERNFSRLSAEIASKAHQRAVMERIASAEEPPVKLNNPPGIRRFEFMVRFFSLPHSGDIDPTLVIAVTFPLFFGMILGDVGYGILAALMALALRSKVKNGFAKDLSGMLLLSGISTVMFGLIFGEFFGGEEMLGLQLHPLIHRSGEGVPLLIGIVLIFAIAHITLGLLIGAVTNAMHGHRKHAYAKAAWLAVFAGLIATVGSIVLPAMFSFAPQSAFLILLAGGAIWLYLLEGIAAIVEIPGLIANTLSYLRVMALGLSGVILAQIINTIPVQKSFGALMYSIAHGADPLAILASLFGLVLFAVFLLLGHALALVLGLFESGVQALRLHYVEFFSKFYRGGGLPFTPLREDD